MARRPIPRPMQLADMATSDGIELLRVEAAARADVREEIEEMEDAIVESIRSAEPKPTDNHLKRDALLAALAVLIAAWFKKIAAKSEKQNADLAKVFGARVVDNVNTALGVDMIRPMAAVMLAAAGSAAMIKGIPIAQWWEAQAADVTRKVVGAVRMGTVHKDTTEGIVARIEGTPEMNNKNGALSQAKQHADALTVTAIQTAVNAANLAVYGANPKVVKAIQWVATLDSRTTIICLGLNGKQWSLPDFKPLGHDKVFPGPTAHYNCRSTQIAVTKTWDEMKDDKLHDGRTFEEAFRQNLADQGFSPEDIEKMVERQREMMNGPVPRPPTTEEWFAGLSRAEQLEKIGPNRLAMWDAGHFTNFGQLTDQRNRPQTLAQLRTKWGLAA